MRAASIKIMIVPYDKQGHEANPIEIELGQCEVTQLDHKFDQSSIVEWNGNKGNVRGKTLSVDLKVHAR